MGDCWAPWLKWKQEAQHMTKKSTSETRNLKTNQKYFFSPRTEFPKANWKAPEVDELMGEGPSYLLLIEKSVAQF